jgi:hypothetical protein
MTAVTLHQTMSLTMPALKKYIIKSIVDVSPVYERIPFESQDQLTQTAPYISSLPTPTFRDINEAGSEISADFAQISNALSIYDNDIKIDPILEMQKNMVVDTRQAQVDAATKAFAFQLVEDYINGDPVNDNHRSFPGLRYQLQYDPRFNGQTANASGNSTEVVLTPGTVTDAQAQGFLYNLTKLISLIDPVYSPDPERNIAFITNNLFILQIAALLRQLKLWNVDRDQFDRKVNMYDGIPFLDAGYTPAGAVSGTQPAVGSKGNWVIGYDSESVVTNNGGNAYDKQTPIYAVHYEQNFQMGVQMQGLTVKDWQQTTSPYYKVVQLRWAVNPAAVWQKRALARLVGYNLSGTT